ELASEVAQRVDALDEISGSLSAATLLPASGDLGDGVVLQQDLMQLALVRDEQRIGSDLETGSQLWRVSARLMAATPAAGVDYHASRQHLRQAVMPVVEAYQQRDWLVRGLHERGGQLAGSAISILFRGVDEAAVAPADGSPEALLGNLLNRSAIQRGGVTYVNLLPLEREGQAGAAARGRAVDALRKSNAAVLLSHVDAGSQTAAAIAQFGNAGIHVVDLATLPSIEESAANVPLETGGPGAVKVMLTGAPMIASAVSEEMTATLRLVWQVVVPGLIIAMMCIVWHPVVGLAAVAATSLPLAITLGAMGWAGLQYDLGVVLIAGLAAGMALDGAVHYVSWFRRGIAADLFRQEA